MCCPRLEPPDQLDPLVRLGQPDLRLRLLDQLALRVRQGLLVLPEQRAPHLLSLAPPERQDPLV